MNDPAKTLQRINSTYLGWHDTKPDSVDECIEDIRRILYPSETERSVESFERWWCSQFPSDGFNLTKESAKEVWLAAQAQP
jgi:hypothetical protein